MMDHKKGLAEGLYELKITNVLFNQEHCVILLPLIVEGTSSSQFFLGKV